METVKQQALNVISQLPEDCSWDEILTELEKLQKSASNSRAAQFEEKLPPLNEVMTKLNAVLQEQFPPPAEIHLEPAADGERVKGTLISESFSGVDDADRQDRLWDILEDKFSQGEQRRILSIIAYTPEEYRAFREEE